MLTETVRLEQIVITALFGNGQSSSPSNRSDLRPFPDVLFYDNIRAQHELVTKKLGIKHAHAVMGWSMGAGQTYQWATQYPDCKFSQWWSFPHLCLLDFDRSHGLRDPILRLGKDLAA